LILFIFLTKPAVEEYERLFYLENYFISWSQPVFKNQTRHIRSSERLGTWPPEPSNCSRFIKNQARMQRAFDDNQCPSSSRGLDCAIKKNARLHKEAELDFGFWGGTMHSDFTVFREHLAEACRDRKKSPDPLCAAAVDLHFAGLRALDVYRLAKIADELDVSVDWLLGRSDKMELPQHSR
jgi:hypothetical protein